MIMPFFTIIILLFDRFMNNNQLQTHKKHYQISTPRLSLRPYARGYVKQYHSWFEQDQQLLYLTGSQPLSLEEQYQNHQSWLKDESKYTFLIFQKKQKGQRMVGDVNLFFSKWIQPHQAQINIMIAVREARGKGYAREALNLIQAFALVYYNRTEIIAKIKDDNIASMKLFEKEGYALVNHSEHFKETQYRKQLDKPKEHYEAVLKEIKEVEDVQGLFKE